MVNFFYIFFTMSACTLIFRYRSSSGDAWWIDKGEVGAVRGCGEMSFPQALGSDRELILHDTRILAVVPIASRNFHGNRFPLESIPSYLQLLFAECPNHTGKKSAFYFKGSKYWYKTHNCKRIQNNYKNYWTIHPCHQN